MAGMCRLLRCLVLSSLVLSALCNGILYPRDSESRMIKNLDGMWNFRADDSSDRNQSFHDKWWTNPLSDTGDVMVMPVPSSFNDITNDKLLRDFVGWVWYDRQFYVSQSWQNQRVVLRFGSANYRAIVWVNGQEVMSHDGGHLPFEGEIIQSVLNFKGENRVTVAVDNRLTSTTLPPGSLKSRSGHGFHYEVQGGHMDFFNYAGIHRHVHLYTTPKVYIDDITIVTSIQGTDAGVAYSIVVKGTDSHTDSNVEVSVEDREGKTVSAPPSNRLQGNIVLRNARFWWPWTMKPDDPGYMYTLKVNISGDVYRQPFGIRTVKVTSNQFQINGHPFYCHGAGKHEDSDIRGKGLDYALIARDFAMLKWLGANCFRTSHYPYAEEIMDQADKLGFVVINESPGTAIKSTANMGTVSLTHHKEVMAEMFQRDKNRPSVCMWSLANEPAVNSQQAEDYFKDLIKHTKDMDHTRPVTIPGVGSGPVAQALDVICVGSWYAWSHDIGHTEVIQLGVNSDLPGTFHANNKPIMVTAYGADAVAGFHQEPSVAYTEEYQAEVLSEYHNSFDKYRSQFLVGEMVWNFADFMTFEDYLRPHGNRKGILTRQRQPKRAGHVIRERYLMLANQTSHM
ncbi:beta-glucuronidase-like [Littorina saxatilis]|uniref:Beta-glucuronidase n=1 Tax=Littorina saxatilis TaxID=31220 RepID=A0AAN9AIF5_9CAEN